MGPMLCPTIVFMYVVIVCDIVVYVCLVALCFFVFALLIICMNSVVPVYMCMPAFAYLNRLHCRMCVPYIFVCSHSAALMFVWIGLVTSGVDCFGFVHFRNACIMFHILLYVSHDCVDGFVIGCVRRLRGLCPSKVDVHGFEAIYAIRCVIGELCSIIKSDMPT